MSVAVSSMAHSRDDDSLSGSPRNEYPSWKTASWDDDEVWPPFEENVAPELNMQHEENVLSEFNMQPIDASAFFKSAFELEKRAADLKAMAQNYRDMAQQKQTPVDCRAIGRMAAFRPRKTAVESLTSHTHPTPEQLNPCPNAVGCGDVGQMEHGYAVAPASVVVVQSVPWQSAPQHFPNAANLVMPTIPMAPQPSQRSEEYPSMAQTTVMWRNIPNNYTRDDLLQLLDSAGFAGSYDFFYSPVDFTSNALAGYAFINFLSSYEADRFFLHFQGFNNWSLMSEKVSQITWSDRQGLEVHIERYRNSPVMHSDVSDIFRPVLLRNGQRIAFPEPTKRIRAPHLKDCRRTSRA